MVKSATWTLLLGVGLATSLAAGGQAPPPPSGSAAPIVFGAPGGGPAPQAAGQPGQPGRGPAAQQPPAPPPSPASVERANKVLAAARQALGGDKLAAMKTLVANGRTKRVRGNNLQPIEFEMSLELPDKFLRKDEFPAEESEPTTSGFNGGELLQPAPAMPPGAAARPGGPGPAAGGRGGPPTPEQVEAQRKARLNTAKQDFVRLALGIFANTFETYPLTFSYAAEAEAPQGKADVLDVTGDGNFKLRLFIHQTTHLPIMVSWQLPPTNVIVTIPGQPAPATVAPGAVVVQGPAAPAATATQEEKDKYAKDVMALRTRTQAAPVEHRLYYADYREVDGVQFPFRLRRAIGADTTEETTFDRFRINTKIDPRKFAVPR